MPDQNRPSLPLFSPDDFDTDFMDDPSATEDKINRRLSLMPTTWIHGLLGTEDWAPSWLKEGYNRRRAIL